jgi:phosphate starvation-inducible PhoH-like protein
LNTDQTAHNFTIEPFEAHRFANLCGQFDENLRLIEGRLGLEIRNRGNQFELIGSPQKTKAAEQLLRRLYRESAASELSPDTVPCSCRNLEWKSW